MISGRDALPVLAAAMSIHKTKAQRAKGGLRGVDVVARCVNCEGPIFNQSKNSHRMNGRRVDGSPKMRHERCPERKAA